MFTLTRLLATLGALVVVPTISYVIGETMETPPPPPPPAIQQQTGTGYPGMMGNQFGNFPTKGDDFKMGQPNNPRCPIGEFWGRNDQGQESCIRGGNPGNMGGGNGAPGMMPENNVNERFKKGTGNGGSFGSGGGNGGGQQFNPGPGGPSQGGPSDEDFKKMEEEQEKRQKQDEERRAQEEKRQLQRMKQEVGRTKQPIAMMRSQIKRIEAQKITVPTEIKEFTVSIEEAVKKIQSAETFEDAQEALETLQEAQEGFREHFETLQRLANWKRIQSQASSEIRRLEASMKRFQRSTKRTGALDISEQLNQFSNVVIGLKATLSKATGLISSSDGEEAIELMDDEFFDVVEDSHDLQRSIESLLNITGFLKQAPAELKRFKSEINALKRRKIDTNEADELLIQMERKLAEIKTIANTKPVDTDALENAIQDGSALVQQFEEIRNNLQGKKDPNDDLFDVNDKLIPSFDFSFGEPPR